MSCGCPLYVLSGENLGGNMGPIPQEIRVVNFGGYKFEKLIYPTPEGQKNEVIRISKVVKKFCAEFEELCYPEGFFVEDGEIYVNVGRGSRKEKLFENEDMRLESKQGYLRLVKFLNAKM